jgi:ribose/xylose/arabinose/galactoside ABC-type transport system permease subunit
MTSVGESPPSPRRALLAFGPWLGLCAAWALFALLAGGNFIALENQRLMLLQTAVVGIAALGATFVIVAGGIDLSVGSNIALTTVVLGLLLRAGAPPWVAVLGALALAATTGAWIAACVNGRVVLAGALALAALAAALLATQYGPVVAAAVSAAVVAAGFAVDRLVRARLPLSPFVVTLGLWGALRGIAKGLADNQPVYANDPGWLPHLMLQSGAGASLPPAVFLLLALAVLLAVVLRGTRLGRHTLAVGSNEATARLCGIDVGRVRLAGYCLAGACAGIAGVLQFAYLSMGDPTTAQGLELRVIAAVVIGGASLSGGEGTLAGTLAGALLMTVIDNGCAKLGVDNWVQEIVTGSIIVGAVALDRWRLR